MIAFLLFPFSAAAAVWLAGRRDASCDPRLSALALGLMLVFPALLLLPKIPVLPVAETAGWGTSGGFPWAMVVGGIWLAGFLVSLARLVLAWVGLHRWRERSAFLGIIAPGVELRSLDGIHGPVAGGIFRKMIFVPETWSAWDEEARQAVLAHELEHHRRHDPALRLLAELAAALHWFNPLARWITRRLALQCEHACDARVVSSGIVKPADYARLLCRFAGAGHAAGIAMAEHSTLEERVNHLMRLRRSGSFVLIAVLAVFALVAALSLSLLAPKAKPRALMNEPELRLSASPFPGDPP